MTRPIKLLVRRDGGCLRPYGDVAWDDFERIPHNKTVVVTVKMARNPEHLAKFWALARVVADHCDTFEDEEDAAEWAKSKIPGMHREYTFADGRLAIKTKSIAEESMDQIAFNRFYDRALYVWSQHIGCDPESLVKESKP